MPFILVYDFRCVEVNEHEFDSLEAAKEAFLDPNGDFDYHPEYDTARVYEVVNGKRKLVHEFCEDDVMDYEEAHQ